MPPASEPDPAVVAAVSASATARHAHHEAGHAVAAVARGGKLTDVFLGTVDWSTLDCSADTSGGTVHRTAYADQPFVTFAGPWFEAKWTVESDSGVEDFNEALEYSRGDNPGDTDKYENRVAELDSVAAKLGFSLVDRAWEAEWADELEPLWPAVCEVATMLVNGQCVTHEAVLAAVDRCRSD
jgi:hypothetical protein